MYSTTTWTSRSTSRRTVLEALRSEVTNTQPVGVEVTFDQGCAVDELSGRVSPAPSEPRPRRMWRSSSLATRPGCLVGGLGEGCDRDDLELPGVQRELAEAVLATGNPLGACARCRPFVCGVLGA